VAPAKFQFPLLGPLWSRRYAAPFSVFYQSDEKFLRVLYIPFKGNDLHLTLIRLFCLYFYITTFKPSVGSGTSGPDKSDSWARGFPPG